MSHKVANDSDHAYAISERYMGQPHGWVQWKGTSACMDFHCKCGAHLHFDVEFLYYVKCGHCKTVYMMSGYVEAIEIKKEPDNCVHESRDHDL